MGIVGYEVKLRVWFRRDGREWIAWAPAIDVITQARTKKQAFLGLREAIELWFESCIARGTLSEALGELGVQEASEEEALAGDQYVRVLTMDRNVDRVSLSPGRESGSDYIEGIVPAYIAADGLDRLTGAPA